MHQDKDIVDNAQLDIHAAEEPLRLQHHHVQLVFIVLLEAVLKLHVLSELTILVLRKPNYQTVLNVILEVIAML